MASTHTNKLQIPPCLHIHITTTTTTATTAVDCCHCVSLNCAARKASATRRRGERGYERYESHTSIASIYDCILHRSGQMWASLLRLQLTTFWTRARRETHSAARATWPPWSEVSEWEMTLIPRDSVISMSKARIRGFGSFKRARFILCLETRKLIILHLSVYIVYIQHRDTHFSLPHATIHVPPGMVLYRTLLP